MGEEGCVKVWAGGCSNKSMDMIKKKKKASPSRLGRRIRLQKVASRTWEAEAPFPETIDPAERLELQAVAGAQRSTTYLLRCT